jgi:hypothetical protein
VEANALEQRIADLVNDAYGLLGQDVRFLRETARPRMRIAPPPEHHSG